MVRMQRSQRTGLRDLVDDAGQDVAAVVDDGAVALDSSRVRGSWVVTAPARARRCRDRGGHVLGVEGAGDLQRAQPGALGRVGGERGELLEGAGRRRSGRRRSRWRR